MRLSLFLAGCILTYALTSSAKTTEDVLVKFAPGVNSAQIFQMFSGTNSKVEQLTESWVKVQLPKGTDLNDLKNHPAVEYVQPNYKIKLYENYKVQDPHLRAQLMMKKDGISALLSATPSDNPAIPSKPTNEKSGPDPLFSKQWGMNDIGVKEGWSVNKGNKDMIVAVIDTGVDYTHPDLLPNIWRNAGETGLDANGKDKSSNGIDDDGNGYVDDVIGWDFAKNDRFPYDLATDPIQLLIGGGNPGHGTHCAGNVGAKAENGIGVVGVAPNTQIMALRFIGDKGEGTTADAIKAIKYAVDNGAKVLSNSWGSEGEDSSEAAENKALRDIITYCKDHNVLFIAAAGNGHNGVGYNNDTDSKPAYPASYDIENIISVAALDSNNQLGSFSNWGLKTVHLGAPGVKVFSTTVGGNYSDMVIDMFGLKVSWDGTSMATPHVAGAAALYWSSHPEKNWKDVKDVILNSTEKITSMNGKSVSGGKLNVKNLMK